jgi:galactose mutarotase-like enzyme
MPVLFPFPGRVTDDEFTFDGRRCRFEPNVGEQFRHGLVADKIWEVERYGVSEEGAYITCSIDSQNYPGIEPTIQQQFPFPFKLSITYILKNDGSTAIRTNIRNTSTDQQLPWAFGLHPYFAFADRSRAKVTVPSPDIWDYTSDGPDKFRPAEGPLNLQAAEGTVLEGLNLDTVYTDRQRPEGNITCRLHDEAGGVEVAIAYDREVFPNTVVHSPDNEQKKADSVCMEPWTSVPDAFNLHIQGNPHSGLRTLAPQEEFTTEVTIAVSNLSKAGAGGTPTTLEKAKQLIRDVANDPEKTGTVKFDVEGLSTATFPLVSNAYLDDINDYLEQTAAKSPDGDKLILQQDKGGNNFIVTAYAEVFEGVVARSTGGRRRRDRGPMVWSRPMENEVTSEQLQELEWLLAWYIVHSKTPATLIWEATGTNELFRADNVSMRRDEANERLYCIEGNPRRWFTKRQVIHLGPTAKADAWLRTRPDIAERLTAAAAIGVVEDDENTANPERFRQVMQARKAKGLVTTIVTKSSGRPETGQIYSIDDMQFGTSLTKPPLNFQVRLYVLGKGSRDIPAPDFLYVGSEENAKGYLEVREENLRKLRAMTTSPPGQKRVYAPAEAIEIVGILRDFSDMRLGSVKYSAPGQEDDIGPLDMMKKIARLSPCGLLIVRIRVQKDTNIFDVFAEPVLVDDPVNMGVSSKTLSLFAGNDDEVWIQRGSGNIDGPARINEVTSQNVRYTLGATPAIMNIPIDDIRVAYLNRPGGPINSFSTAAAAAGYKTIAEIETAVFMNLRAIARQLMDAATVEEAQDVLGVNLANLDGIFTPADGIPGFEDIKEKTRPARDLLAEKAASAETTVAVEDAFEVYLNAVIGAVRETAGSDAYLNYAIPRVLDSTAGAAAETAVAEAKGRGDRGPSSFGRPPGAFGTRDIAREVPSREEELNVLIGNMHPQMSAADTKLCVIVTPGVVATGLPRLVSQMGFENITIVELSAEQMANIKGAAAEDLGEFLRTTAVDEAHPADSYRFCYMYSDDLQLNIKLTEIAPFDITMVLPETLLMNPLIYLRDAFGVTVADENLKSAQDALKAAQALATGV